MTASSTLRVCAGALVAVFIIQSFGCNHTQPSASMQQNAVPLTPGAIDSTNDIYPGNHAELREELLAMKAVDHEVRFRVLRAKGKERDALNEECKQVDRRHTRKMKQILGKFGWPTRSMVGDRGAQAAWLLTQHADHDIEHQRRCLKMMEALIDEEEVFRRNVAYLTDRVLVHEGKPQVYGTQVHEVNGKRVPKTLIDPKNVDVRRKSMGLNTLAEYIEFTQT